MPTQLPIPTADETLDRYTIRCASLAGDMDPDDFNESVWETWKQHRGPTDEEEVARRKFSPERYEIVPGVCVFAEHKTTTADGTKRNYKLRDLVKIVRGNNERISDVAAFPAISDGHTSSPGDANPREPRILGYAGNYRLGRIGRRKPRWAIFQDEYHMKSAAEVLDSKPRRSVELWTFSDGRSHFDPVAAIGAEAPRLPLPQRFSTLSFEGASCERYTFQAGSMGSPGMGSTFVPTAGSKRKPAKANYSAGDVSAQPDPTGEEDMRLNPEDIQQIVAAIAETKQWQWLTEQMDKEMAPDPVEGDDLDDDFVDDTEGETDDFSDLDDLAGPDEDEVPVPDDLEPTPEPEPELEERNTMYQANKDDAAKVEKPAKPAKSPEASVDKYTALQASHNDLMKDFTRATERVTLLERRNADLDRRSRLDKLANQFPGIVDVDEEAKVALYSLGGEMTDDQFDKHIATVEKYANRAAQASVYIPEGDAPHTEVEPMSPEKYAQAERVKKMALSIHADELKKGNSLTYDEAKAKAIERLSK